MAKKIQAVDLPVSTSKQLKSYTSGSVKEVYGFRSDKHAEKVLRWHDRSLLRSYNRVRSEEIWSSLKIVFVFILFLSLGTLIVNVDTSPLSFQSFLNLLGSIEPVDFSSMLDFTKFQVDWDESIPVVGAIIGVLETIINMSLGFMSVLQYIALGLMKAIEFFITFLRFVFTV